MATYYRPNLTVEQHNLLMQVIEEAIKETYGIDDPDFDPLYQVLIRLRSCKAISTDKREG
jgi:hypothetical protein